MGTRFDTPLRIHARDLDRLLKDDRLVVVAFEAAENGPCALLASRLEEVARELGPRAVVVRVQDADDASLAARHHLLWLPTIAFWHRGRERLRLTGAAPLEALLAHVRYLLDGGPLPAPASGPRRAAWTAFGPLAHR